MNWANAIIQGILLGGLYALFATGLSLAFGVMRFVNLAHGDLAILAAYFILSWRSALGGNLVVTLAVVVAVMAVIGFVSQRGIFNFTLGADPLPGILVSFGIGIVLQNVLLERYSATDVRIDVGDILTRSIRLNDRISIGWFPLLILLVAVAVLGGLQLFLSFTRLGRAFRATSDDPATAQLMGINDKRLYAGAMSIAFGAVALAGFFEGSRTTFSPTSGGFLLLFAFEAVVIGGIGSLWGTLAGGIVLGVVQNVANQQWIGSNILAGHIVFLLVLAFRPYGLFGTKGRA